MNVVWHDDNAIQSKTLLISPQTSFQCTGSCFFWKFPTKMGGESYENNFMIALIVR